MTASVHGARSALGASRDSAWAAVDAQAVADGRRPENMTEDQEIVYEFSRELNETRGVSDRTYARMVGKFGEQGMMDLVGLNGYYSLISMVLNVGHTPLPAGVQPGLKPLPR